MSLSQAQIRAHVFLTVLEKFSSTAERRREALEEYFMVTMPTSDAAAHLAQLIPDLMPELYRKWIDLFVDRLFETIPDEQLQHLCDGTVENNASLGLVFLMFMESERMEKQVEEDLREYGLKHSQDEDMGNLVADYLRGKVEALRVEVQGAKLQ